MLNRETFLSWSNLTEARSTAIMRVCPGKDNGLLTVVERVHGTAVHRLEFIQRARGGRWSHAPARP